MCPPPIPFAVVCRVTCPPPPALPQSLSFARPNIVLGDMPKETKVKDDSAYVDEDGNDIKGGIPVEVAKVATSTDGEAHAAPPTIETNDFVMMESLDVDDVGNKIDYPSTTSSTSTSSSSSSSTNSTAVDGDHDGDGVPDDSYKGIHHAAIGVLGRHAQLAPPTLPPVSGVVFVRASSNFQVYFAIVALVAFDFHSANVVVRRDEALQLGRFACYVARR